VKLQFKCFTAALAITVCLVTAGCNHDPNPPTEADAIAVAKRVNRCIPPGNENELISLKKTNGQMETVNGVKVYTLYYTATERHLTPVGVHPAGWVQTWSSNYPFEWTEGGWRGPDGQVYSKH